MIKNYFRTSIRFLWKNKKFSLINIIGLTAGTFCCLYILLYVREQFSYDRQVDKNIYRITFIGKTNGGSPAKLPVVSPSCWQY